MRWKHLNRHSVHLVKIQNVVFQQHPLKNHSKKHKIIWQTVWRMNRRHCSLTWRTYNKDKLDYDLHRTVLFQTTFRPANCTFQGGCVDLTSRTDLPEDRQTADGVMLLAKLYALQRRNRVLKLLTSNRIILIRATTKTTLYFKVQTKGCKTKTKCQVFGIQAWILGNPRRIALSYSCYGLFYRHLTSCDVRM